jgi:hypothetical protein
MQPSIILYKFKGKFKVSPIKYDLTEVNSWYKAMRSRVDGLSIVLTVDRFNENLKDPNYKAYINNEISSYPLPD